jgi:hypothetical protein
VRARVSGVHPLQAAEIDDRVDRGHVAVEPALFGQEADRRGVAAIGRTAEHLDRARSRPDDVEHHAQGGRLPRAVAAEEAEDLARLHGKAEVVDRQHVGETLGQRLDLQNTHQFDPQPSSNRR